MNKRDQERVARLIGGSATSDLRTLARQVAVEIINRKRGETGLAVGKFRKIHNSRIGCEVEEKVVGSEPSGFYDTVFDGEAWATVAVYHCKTHNVASANFWSGIHWL